MWWKTFKHTDDGDSNAIDDSCPDSAVGVQCGIVAAWDSWFQLQDKELQKPCAPLFDSPSLPLILPSLHFSSFPLFSPRDAPRVVPAAGQELQKPCAPRSSSYFFPSLFFSPSPLCPSYPLN